MPIRYYKPRLFWFALAVVVLPAALSSLSLAILDGLLLSVNRLVTSEANTAIATERLSAYVSKLECLGANLVTAYLLGVRGRIDASDLSPELQIQLDRLRSIAHEHCTLEIPEIQSFSRGKQVISLNSDLLRHTQLPTFNNRGAARKYLGTIKYIASEAFFYRQAELVKSHIKNQFKSLDTEADRTGTDVLAKIERVRELLFAYPLDGSGDGAGGLGLNRIGLIRVASDNTHLAELSQSFVKQKRLQLTRIREQGQILRRTLTSSAYGCFAVSLLLAIALVAAYSRYISLRLTRLVGDAELISRGGNTFSRLDGNDELSYVQDVLFDVHRRLADMAEFRRFIVDMVAHDVRAPLMGAQMSLRLARESLSEDDAAQTTALERDLHSTIVVVERLLALERASPSKIEPGANGVDLATNASVQKRILSPLLDSGMFKKLLLFVALPLLLQTVWLCGLTGQVAVENSLSAHQQILDDQMLGTLTVMHVGCHALNNRLIYAFTGADKFKAAALKDSSLLEETMDRLRLLPPSSSFDDNYTDELKRAVDQLVHRPLVQDPVSIGKDQTFIRSMTSACENLLQIWYPMIDDRLSTINRLQSTRQAFALKLQNWIWAGLIGNVVFFLLLLLLFFYNFKRRLTMLIFSAASLAEPTSPKVFIGGTDELHTLGEAMNRSKEELKRSMEARALIISQVANDMCAPLTVAKSTLNQMIVSKGETIDERALDDLRAAEENIRQVIELIADLFTVEQLESGVLILDRSSYPVSAVIDEAIQTVHALAAQKSVGISYQSTNAFIHVDKSRILQVLVNLLSNAIKFSPPNSQVRVTGEETDSQVRISINDQGPGIDEETATKIFDRFYKADTVILNGGFGLGLFIAKMIIEMHGGGIDVDSERQAGSTFSITLPKSET